MTKFKLKSWIGQKTSPSSNSLSLPYFRFIRKLRLCSEGCVTKTKIIVEAITCKVGYKGSKIQEKCENLMSSTKIRVKQSNKLTKVITSCIKKLYSLIKNYILQ